jgi:hypothetical protein
MATVANTITSDVQTTFSTPPTVGTALSGDNTTTLASIGYLNSQSITNATYLDRTSNQTITGTYTINTPSTLPRFFSIDTPNIGDTLTLGKAGDTRLEMRLATIKGVVQKLVYWAVGNANTTTSTGTAVDCQKVQTGQLVWNVATTIPVVFSPAFNSTPVIVLGQQRTGTLSYTPDPRWVTNATRFGFDINYPTTSATYRLNWLAIGT